MSVFRAISDLHLGHATIHEKAGALRNNCASVIEHDNWIVKQFNSVVKKWDVTLICGDVAFTPEGLELVRRLNGKKNLILGNHDEQPLEKYMELFQRVHGIIEHRGFYISHAPIMPTKRALWGRGNIHGHTHSDEIGYGPNYCVCVEALNGVPIEFSKIEEIHERYLRGQA